MPNLTLILLIFFPLSLNAWDHYRAEFSDSLNTVTVEACFDGEAPRQLHRHVKAGLFTDWVRSGEQHIRNRSRNGLLSLPDLADDACVEWRVDLSAAAEEKEFRLALRLKNAMLSSGNLWFWRDNERREIRVEVTLPPDVSISTPWAAVEEGGKNLYRPARTPATWTSRIAVGRFPVQRLAVDGAGLRLSVLGELQPARREEIAGWITETAESVASVSGRFPQNQPQVLVVSVGRQGEAVPWAHIVRGGGIAAEFFVDETRPVSQFRTDWTATHELSHMVLPYVSSRDRWLSEGLASYYQNVLRARDGRLTEVQAWQKLYAGFQRGERGTNGGSLTDASRGGWSSTMRVYWSGAAMLLKADIRLRELSGGRQSLDTAVSSLQDCCFEEGRVWRAIELFQRMDRESGYTVFMDLYNEHVADDEFPDMSTTLAELGVVPQQGSVAIESGAPKARIRQQIMNDGGRKIPQRPFQGSTRRPPP